MDFTDSFPGKVMPPFALGPHYHHSGWGDPLHLKFGGRNGIDGCGGSRYKWHKGLGGEREYSRGRVEGSGWG